MEQRGARDRELRGDPAAAHVAEVDQAARPRPPVGRDRADDVVAGDVAVDGRDPQLLLDACQPLAGGGRDRYDPLAPGRIGHVRGEGRNHRLAVAEIPLQPAVQSRRVEVGERAARRGGQAAHAGAHGRGQVAEARERRAVEEREQADGDVAAAEAGMREGGAVARRLRPGHRQAGAGEVLHRRVLALEPDLGHGRVGDLQHVTAVVGVDAEVPVLLAAELGDRAGHAEDAPGDVGRLLGAHVRRLRLRRCECRHVGTPAAARGVGGLHDADSLQGARRRPARAGCATATRGRSG